MLAFLKRWFLARNTRHIAAELHPVGSSCCVLLTNAHRTNHHLRNAGAFL